MRSSKILPVLPSLTSQRSLIRDETDLNRCVRTAIKRRMLSVVHLRETDVPGATDLVIWKGIEIWGWVELKMNDEAVRKSQIEFMNERRKETNRVYVVRYYTVDETLHVIPWGQDQVFALIKDFKTYDWADGLRRWSIDR